MLKEIRILAPREGDTFAEGNTIRCILAPREGVQHHAREEPYNGGWA